MTPGRHGRRWAMQSALLLGASVVAFGCASDARAITAVKGGACGYITNAGLFGGPQDLRGCGQTSGGPTSAGPEVDLPRGGSDTAITAGNPDGARAMYGPAAIFAGRWPDGAAAAPPSGPLTVSTKGSAAAGSVTSTADIGLHATPIEVGCATGFTPPCTAPGGIGGQVDADEVHTTCTATRDGVSGSARFVNAILTLTTDPTGEPATQEPLPENPPPNYTRSVLINNVGGHPTIVFNEQLVNPDGSLTVNAYHMYLFGPVAVGEKIVGQVTCGTTPSPLKPKDTTKPTCGIPVVELATPDDPTPLLPIHVHLGVFDSGGIASVATPEVINGTVQVGRDPASEHAYLKFVPGQTGPLTVIGIQADPDRPFRFSFEATDKAGNTTHCESGEMPTATSPAPG